MAVHVISREHPNQSFPTSTSRLKRNEDRSADPLGPIQLKPLPKYGSGLLEPISRSPPYYFNRLAEIMFIGCVHPAPDAPSENSLALASSSE
jgi:hypothetical protein